MPGHGYWKRHDRVESSKLQGIGKEILTFQNFYSKISMRNALLCHIFICSTA